MHIANLIMRNISMTGKETYFLQTTKLRTPSPWYQDNSLVASWGIQKIPVCMVNSLFHGTALFYWCKGGWESILETLHLIATYKTVNVAYLILFLHSILWLWTSGHHDSEYNQYEEMIYYITTCAHTLCMILCVHANILYTKRTCIGWRE